MPKLEILSPEQSNFIQLLLEGNTQAEAARQMGINLRRAQRWLTLPHVKAAYDEIKANVSDHVHDQIKALSNKAIKALEESLELQDSPTVRLKAAQLVLDRVAPEQAQSDQPLQGNDGLIEKRLLPYLTNEELSQVEVLIHLAEGRAQQAESDRETLERKRM